jgi:hypothetical protein
MFRNNISKIKPFFIILLGILCMQFVALQSFAQDAPLADSTLAPAPHADAAAHDPHAAHGEKKGFDIKELLFGHVMDTHNWHIFSIGRGHDATHISLPLFILLLKD